MSSFILCLLAVLCPQKQGPSRLVLPQTRAPQPQRAQEPELTEVERFHRDVLQLRRSARLTSPSQDLVLKEVSAKYEQPIKLSLDLARTADADLMYGLLQVMRRLGVDGAIARGQDVQAAAAARELQFLLLTRPFGAATRLGVTVMAELSGENAKDALMSCFTARYSGVRKAATDLLLARIDRSDTARILALSHDDKPEVERKALFLLGALPYPEAHERLIAALSASDPLTAATACESLIDHGPDVAPALQAIVARPALGRAFGYAAFALAMLEDQTGRELLSDEMVVNLRAELTGTDGFMAATVAMALTNIAFRSTDAKGLEYGDREIVDGLLGVVAPGPFVPNFSLLQKPAARKLVLFTGCDFRGRSTAWRAWWDRARPGFVGTRLAIAVTPEVGAEAVLTWVGGDRVLEFRGERAPAPAAREPDDQREVDRYLLTGAEVAALVARLHEQGFMTSGLLASAAAAEMLPVAREIELRVGSSRSHVAGPVPPARWLDALQAEVDNVAERERWQLYRNPATEPNAVAFWQAEREWLAAHADRRERERRLVDRILAAYPSLSPAARARSVDHLTEIPELRALLTESDGLALLRLVRDAGAIDTQVFRLVEIAALAPGDSAWRNLLDLVDDLHEKGGAEALPQVFALLGPDSVLAAIRSSRPRVRVAAAFEASKLRDLRAVPLLIAGLQEQDRVFVEAAVYSLGVLGIGDAREPLLELQDRSDIAPQTRRVAWVALGRLGGERVLPLLQAGLASPELDDRLAAIQALGELRDLEAAHFLAQIFVAQGLNPIGTQAMASLQKMGGLLARPALRPHLSTRDLQVRREIVMLLAELADPAVVPDLLALLAEDQHQARVLFLLAGITGVELAGVDGRIEVMREWWRIHKDQPQASWFLQSLKAANVETTLQADQLLPGAGLAAVDELTRIMLETDRPHLRVLAAALLRDVTDRDFGLISFQTPASKLQAVADRYRFFAAAERAAQGR